MVTAQSDPDLYAASRPSTSLSKARAVAVYPRTLAPAPRTLWQILEATAEAFPAAIAIDDGRSKLNYLDLLAGAGMTLSALRLWETNDASVELTCADPR